ncbi:hypothetical protein ACFWPQ_08950 [Streptomyces sp. NPDC058464]|uniref:hypothetical protein n=1 Tax=Streptomyces sp. NPDC058464 TaxID=3346511 RepID=UPI003648FBC1
MEPVEFTALRFVRERPEVPLVRRVWFKVEPSSIRRIEEFRPTAGGRTRNHKNEPKKKRNAGPLDTEAGAVINPEIPKIPETLETEYQGVGVYG